MDREEAILKAFPALQRVKDQALKESIIRIWVQAWERSKWENLEEAPFNPDFPDISLVSHVNCVVDLVLSSAQILERYYPEIKLDEDVLIAGALLHDVSKLLEIEPQNGKATFSELTKAMPHAVYGAHLALKENIPLKIVNMILAHTKLTGAIPQTPEGVLLHYIDYGMADVLRSKRSLRLILDGGPRYGKR